MIINTKFNTYSYNKNNLPVKSKNTSNLSFNGSKLPLKMTTGFVGTIAVLWTLATGYNLSNAYSYTKGKNKKEISKEIEWESNIRVLAGTGQNTLGATAEDKSSYTKYLSELLLKNGIKTPEQANDSLAKNGYKINCYDNAPEYCKTIFSPTYLANKLVSNKKLYSLATPSKPLNIFNKDAKNKDRFILGINDPTEERFSKLNNKFITLIKTIDGVKNENIIQIASFENKEQNLDSILTTNQQNLDSIFNRLQKPQNCLENIERGLDSIVNKINKLKNRNNVELLIIYNGHGEAQELKNGSAKREGAMEGILNGGIEEKQVKELFKKKLKGIKTLFIINNCHAGAWIAENTATKNWTKEMTSKAVKYIV